ncbi:MAG: DUF523 domain-containing protein [Candidatus Omnitrophica bacterium]|nr:DUF523 domain-containing protein [Candidatus Omnitrophota bacterium]
MPKKTRIGISACLLGKRTRYDGRYKGDRHVTGLFGRSVLWVPICPEVECGLPVPREPLRLSRTARGTRLVTKHTGIDHTVRIRAWIKKKIRELKKSLPDGFILKSGSPSCGLRLPGGRGIFAGALRSAFPDTPFIDEKKMRIPCSRRKFMKAVGRAVR